MSGATRIEPGPVLKAVAAVLALAGFALAARTAMVQMLSEESLRTGLEGMMRQAAARMGKQVPEQTISDLARTASGAAVRERSSDRRWMMRAAIAALFVGAGIGVFLGRPSPTRSVGALSALLGGLVAYFDLKDLPATLDFSSAIGGGFHLLSLLVLGLVPLAALFGAALSFKALWTTGGRA